MKPIERNRSHLLLPTLLLAALALAPLRQDEAPPVVGVPIGAILVWWGLEQDIPEGFEACDGRTPTTRDAVFRDRKPDLRKKFLRGADEPRSFVPRAFKGGGSEAVALQVDPHELKLDEIPAHLHAQTDHVHAIGPHTHDVDPDPLTTPNHSHTIGNSVTVAAGNNTSVISAAGSGSSTGQAQVQVDLPSKASANNTGGVTTSTTSVNTGRAGGQPNGRAKPHSHKISASVPDLRPPFLDVLYIIRVK